MLLLALTSAWSIRSPGETGLGVHPASWSNTPLSCLTAPAGLGRLGEFQIQVTLGVPGDGYTAAAAAARPLGKGFTAGAGGGWNETDGSGLFQLSSCYVITGDPIGFMEGLYGPSITAGAAATATYNDSTGSSDVSFDSGIQFSLFPSFALGLNCTDIAGEASFTTGFSHVFNRNLRVHVSYSRDMWRGGAELTVKPFLQLLAGTDGSGFNGGLLYRWGTWTGSYGAAFLESSIEHSFGLSRRFR